MVDQLLTTSLFFPTRYASREIRLQPVTIPFKQPVYVILKNKIGYLLHRLLKPNDVRRDAHKGLSDETIEEVNVNQSRKIDFLIWQGSDVSVDLSLCGNAMSPAEKS